MTIRYLPLLRAGLPCLLTSLSASLALAQAQPQPAVPPQLPDAGRLLQENRRPQSEPLPAAPLNIPAPSTPAAQPGALAASAAVSVSAVRIEGLSSLNPQALAASLGPLAGRSFDLAGLRALAAQVQEQVRAAGYLFARAYLPAQDLASGVLRIAVVEGRYREVGVTGDAATATAARPWLQRLRPGEAITAAPLERALLLLGDLPGLQSASTLSPGAAIGTGNLAVQVTRIRPVSGEVGIDNHGNYYAGRGRVRAALDIDSPFVLGDQLAFRASYSLEGTSLGSAAYSLPIGSDGLRTLLSASRTDYELGREFASLGAHGTADVLSASVAWPLLRSRDSNLRLSGGLQEKRLVDERDSAASKEAKRVLLLPLLLSGDRRDSAGLTWGSIGISLGHLELGVNEQVADAASARTQGRFAKASFEAARIQALSSDWSAYARLAGQWADKNLDSSEKFVLGGAYGVRAWPSGEAVGDAGVLAQVELRWRIGSAEPYVFIDAGRIRVNQLPFAAGDNTRTIAGPGIGLRWSQGPWSTDATLARRAGGQAPTAEPGASRVHGLISAGYRF